MTDLELFESLSKRDYTMSDKDKYAQWLQTLFFQLPKDEFLNLLRLAEKQGKKIKTKFPYAEEQTIKMLYIS